METTKTTTDTNLMLVKMANGKWKNFYGACVTFNYEGKQYLFAQTKTSDCRWFISELDQNGSELGRETSTGHWNNYYGSMTTFIYEDETYLFAQTSTSNNRWFISKLTPTSNMEYEYRAGNFDKFYGSVVAFESSDSSGLGLQNYLYAQTEEDNSYFIAPISIYERITINPSNEGVLDNYYGGTALLSYPNGSNYLFAQTENDNFWSIRLLNSHASSVQTIRSSGNWGNYYSALAPIPIGDDVYLYGQSETTRYFFAKVNQSEGGGLINQETGNKSDYYGAVAQFTTPDAICLFHQTDDGDKWYIDKVIYSPIQTESED